MLKLADYYVNNLETELIWRYIYVNNDVSPSATHCMPQKFIGGGGPPHEPVTDAYERATRMGKSFLNNKYAQVKELGFYFLKNVICDKPRVW